MCVRVCSCVGLERKQMLQNAYVRGFLKVISKNSFVLPIPHELVSWKLSVSIWFLASIRLNSVRFHLKPQLFPRFPITLSNLPTDRDMEVTSTHSAETAITWDRRWFWWYRKCDFEFETWGSSSIPQRWHVLVLLRNEQSEEFSCRHFSSFVRRSTDGALSQESGPLPPQLSWLVRPLWVIEIRAGDRSRCLRAVSHRVAHPKHGKHSWVLRSLQTLLM